MNPSPSPFSSPAYLYWMAAKDSGWLENDLGDDALESDLQNKTPAPLRPEDDVDPRPVNNTCMQYSSCWLNLLPVSGFLQGQHCKGDFLLLSRRPACVRGIPLSVLVSCTLDKADLLQVSTRPSPLRHCHRTFENRKVQLRATFGARNQFLSL